MSRGGGLVKEFRALFLVGDFLFRFGIVDGRKEELGFDFFH